LKRTTKIKLIVNNQTILSKVVVVIQELRLLFIIDR